MAKTDATFRSIYLDKSAGYIIKVIDEIRRISKALLPPGLHFMDLLEGVKALLDDLQLIHPINMGRIIILPGNDNSFSYRIIGFGLEGVFIKIRIKMLHLQSAHSAP